jgi:hypothetical protein
LAQLALVGCAIALGVSACTMREPASPAEMNEPPVASAQPAAFAFTPTGDVSTLVANTDRESFQRDVEPRLQAIDARIAAITPLYATGSPANKERLSFRWKQVHDKRAALDTNRAMLAASPGADWVLPKGDIVMNIEMIEHALDDLELTFKK